MRREILLISALLAGGAIWFGFRQLPTAVISLRVLAAAITWTVAMSVVLLASFLGKLLKVRRQGLVLMLTAVLVLLALLVVGVILSPDRRPYNFDPAPSTMPASLTTKP